MGKQNYIIFFLLTILIITSYAFRPRKAPEPDRCRSNADCAATEDGGCTLKWRPEAKLSLPADHCGCLPHTEIINCIPKDQMDALR